MDNLLEETLKKIAEQTVKSLETSGNPDNPKIYVPKRIVLYSSSKLNNPILVFNYLENCLLNTQFMIRHKIPIQKTDFYNEKIHKLEGDYLIDISYFLGDPRLKPSSFLP